MAAVPVFRDLYLEATTFCNLQCSHCYHPNHDAVHPSVNTLIGRAHEVDAFNYIITGGEPTFHPNFEELTKCFRFFAPNLCLMTNGTNTKKNLKTIVKNYDVVTLSLDFPDARHDDNRRRKGLIKEVENSVRSIVNARELDRPKVNLICVMMKSNLGLYNDILELGEEWGADGVVFERYIPVYDSKPMLTPSELVTSIRKIMQHKGPCEPSLYEVFAPVVGTEGVPRIRCKQRAFVNTEGRWKTCPFDDYTFSSPIDVFHHRFLEPLPYECLGCKYTESCHGGCPTCRKLLSDDHALNGKDCLCPL